MAHHSLLGMIQIVFLSSIFNYINLVMAFYNKMTYKKIAKNSQIISLDYLKNYLRVINTEDDELILNCYLTAQEIAEQYMNTCLNIYQIELNVTVDYDYINIPYQPLVSIISVHSSDIAHINLSDLKYVESREQLHITNNALINKVITVNYLAGYADYKDLPKPILQGLLLHTAELYDKQFLDQTIINSIYSLYRPYIRYKL